MTTKSFVLAARVKGVNHAHTFANELFPKLVTLFTPFVGCQIEKKEGGLLAKIQKLVDALNLPNTVSLSVFRHQSNYSLAFTVKTCQTVPAQHYDHAYYYEVTLYVGETQNGVLTKVCDNPNYKNKTDYTTKQVEAARKAYEEAEKAADTAKSSLYPFGEYDH